MSQPYIAEIRIFPFNFAPRGYALCNGQLLNITTNTALFSLVGTYYGGNGTSNFALPNLQGSAVNGQGQGPGLSNYNLGQKGGTSAVTLNTSQLPSHNHTPTAKPGGNLSDPNNNVWGDVGTQRPAPNFYATAQGTPNQMNVAAIGLAGGSLPHNNLMPYLVLNFCIALQGVYPARP
jgi:microcystin-dependent protein